MKKYLIIYLLINTTCYSQTSEPPYKSTISLTHKRILYWNMPNRIEYVTAKSYDSTWVKISDGIYIQEDENSGYITPYNHRTCTLTIMGMNDGDTISLESFGYRVLHLPTPEIWLLNINLGEDLSKLKDTALFENRVFRAGYDLHMSELVGAGPRINFKIVKWKVMVGETLYSGESGRDTDELYDAIFNSDKGTEIKYESFDVLIPDGRIKTIFLDNSYYKQTKKGVIIPRKKLDLTGQPCGGVIMQIYPDT